MSKGVNKQKKTTLVERSENVGPTSMYSMSHELAKNTFVFIVFGEQCSERRHFFHNQRLRITDPQGPWADRFDS